MWGTWLCNADDGSSSWKLLFTRPIAPDEEFVRLHRRMSARRRHPVRMILSAVPSKQALTQCFLQ